MKRAGIVVVAALLVLAAAAPARAVTGLVSNGANNFGVGDRLNLAVGVTHTGPDVAADVYAVLVIPGGTPIFFTLGPGGIRASFTPAPLVSGVTLPNGLNTGLIPLFGYTFTGVELFGAYQTILAFTAPGTTNILNMTSQSFFVVPVPLGANLGTYTGDWTNHTFSTTGPSVIRVLDSEPGLVTIVVEQGGNVFGTGQPATFTLPVSIERVGGTVDTMTQFGPLTATINPDFSFQGQLTFDPGSFLETLTFTGNFVNGVIRFDYVVNPSGGFQPARGTVTGTRQ